MHVSILGLEPAGKGESKGENSQAGDQSNYH